MKFDDCSDTLDKLKLFQPDVVFINLGENSISTQTERKELTEWLCERVKFERKRH